MEVNIKCELPFSWCADCDELDLATVPTYSAEEGARNVYACKNAAYCEACEEARQRAAAYMDKCYLIKNWSGPQEAVVTPQGEARKADGEESEALKAVKIGEALSAGFHEGLAETAEEWQEGARKMLIELKDAVERYRMARAQVIKSPKSVDKSPKSVDLDAEAWEIEGPFGIGEKDPYDEAAAIVEAWCKKNGYDTFLVTLSLDGETRTEILDFNEEVKPCWETDWWEGEKKIRVLGFRPVSDFRIYGAPKEMVDKMEGDKRE